MHAETRVYRFFCDIMWLHRQVKLFRFSSRKNGLAYVERKGTFLTKKNNFGIRNAAVCRRIEGWALRNERTHFCWVWTIHHALRTENWNLPLDCNQLEKTYLMKNECPQIFLELLNFLEQFLYQPTYFTFIAPSTRANTQ